MMVSVRTTSISAERLWDVETPLPAPVQIQLNVTVHKLEPAGQGKAKGSFVVSATYNPAVAQITIRGVVLIQGSEKEVKEAVQRSSSGKPPEAVVQAVFSSAMADAVVASRSIGVPPPLPAPVISRQQRGQQASGSLEYAI